MNLQGMNFSLSIDGLSDDTFSVAEFSLNESLSELFVLTLEVVSKNAAVDMKSLLLQTASFSVLTNGQTQRSVVGVVASVMKGTSGFSRTFYTITIRPELWLLTLKKDSRIFHFKSAAEIIDQILAEHGVSFENKLFDSHSVREYVTQKRETDYEFISRLAAEEGISFWFEVADDNSPSLFYSDSRLGCTASLAMIYNPHPQPTDVGNLMTELTFGAQMTSTQAIFKDRTYQNPRCRLMHTGESVDESDGLTVFDSYGRFQDDNTGKPFTQYRLDALCKEHEVGCGKSNCISVRPGEMFALTEHPDSTLNSRWQVVSVHHQGRLPQVLEEESDGSAATLCNVFKFIPSMVEWRPDFIHKPQADGAEVAEVVGPAGEEIYTNADGSIKVHFHWNRYDKADENASCWVRVAQGWNGDNFGFSAIPRIGQEVIITYLNGDIDRPLVSGCVYNAINRPPLNLPAEKTRTTFKTKTHKGNGFNELRFDDDNSHEEIFLHAQKDYNLEIKHDQTSSVGHDVERKIDNDRRTAIGQNETIEIGRDRQMTVGQDQKIEIGRNQATKIGSHYRLEVMDQRTEFTHANHDVEIDGQYSQKIQGKLHIEAGDGVLIHTNQLTLNGSDKVVIQGPSGKITIDGGGVSIDAPSIKLNGPVSVSTGRLGPLAALKSAAQAGTPLVEICQVCSN